MTKAHRLGLSDDEIVEYEASYRHATALEALQNRLLRQDDKAHDAARNRFVANPGLARL